jgi:hypothetical protein
MPAWEKDRPDFLGRPSALVEASRKIASETAAAVVNRPRGIIGRVREAVANAARKVYEAASGGGTLLGQWGGYGDADFIGYRPLGQRIDKLTRDLDSWMYDKQIRMALYIYATNPMGRWLIENLVDVTLGQRVGFTVKVDPVKLKEWMAQSGAASKPAGAKLTELADPSKAKPSEELDDENDTEDGEELDPLRPKPPKKKVKSPEQIEAERLEKEIYQHLEIFWTHPAHSLDTRAREFASTYLVTGALLIPVSVNEIDGVPMLDLIDAQQIAKVESADKSAIVPGVVWYRGMDQAAETKPLKVIRQVERQGVLTGEAFYFPLRSLVNQLMGTSYLLDVIDWLDRHDQFMFAGLDRAKLANNYAVHVKMDGFTAQQCIDHAAALKKQGFLNDPAAVVVTNEKGGIDIVSPDLRSGDIDTLSKTYRTHILGAKNRPEAWYSSGGETNRATAGEQTDVAYKAMERWQDTFRGMLETMLHFAYDCGKSTQREGIRRNWPDRKSGAVTISVNLPPIRERDYARLGEALTKIEQGLKASVDDEMLSLETARTVLQTTASKLGADIDPTKEQERIDNEAEEREARRAEMANAMAARALADALPEDEEPEPGEGKKAAVKPAVTK